VKTLITELLGSSPVAPLQKHIKTVYECACQLPKLVQAANQGDWDTAKKLHEEIARLENEADRLKFQIRSNLPKSLFMPVPRQDLLELVLVQDKIANITRDVSGIIIALLTCAWKPWVRPCKASMNWTNCMRPVSGARK